MNELTRELCHHGILGQKWGVRRYQNKDGTLTDAGIKRYHNEGGTLKKGSKVYRVSLTKDDVTYDNKKYLSTTKADHKIWKEYFGKSYDKMGYKTYDISYKTTKDIKIASETELGKAFVQVMMTGNRNNLEKIQNDTNNAISFLRYKPSQNEIINETKMASLNIAAQTETGKAVVEMLLKEGFGGVTDTHGRNTAEDPIIVFDPDKNLKKVSVKSNRV